MIIILPEAIHKEISGWITRRIPFYKNIYHPNRVGLLKNLAQMNLDNELLDDISMVGPKSSSIFTDEKRPSRTNCYRNRNNDLVKIVFTTRIYLHSITTQGLLQTSNTIAQDIIDSHDSNYKFLKIPISSLK